jgi:ribonuclease-3
VTDRRAVAVGDLERRIGHTFQDRQLLELALTHASVGDGAKKAGDNEVLEFIGDRVLGLLAAEALAERFPKAKEGELAPRLNALVSRETCARVSRAANVGPALRLSASSSKIGGRETDSILAGAAEALMAALYRDGGLETRAGCSWTCGPTSSTRPARASRAIPRPRCRNGPRARASRCRPTPSRTARGPTTRRCSPCR